MKRVLKSASPLSVFSNQSDDLVFLLGNDAHCSCDLHVDGPDGLGGGISIVSTAGESLVKIAEAAIGAGFSPLEFRVFWGNEEPVEEVAVTLAEWRALVAQNSFNGRLSYLVSP